METKYKPVSVGKGMQLYRVVRRADDFNTSMTVSGNVGTPEKPWTVRWSDFFGGKHEEHFRTRIECLNFLEGH